MTTDADAGAAIALRKAYGRVKTADGVDLTWSRPVLERHARLTEGGRTVPLATRYLAEAQDFADWGCSCAKGGRGGARPRSDGRCVPPNDGAIDACDRATGGRREPPSYRRSTGKPR
ncbi:hypothetical protein [Nonomuraea soli]|uniref:Uncharacterized protein n=1 Tax=Nonomuraea soli TaxID=1032476 RepID=A0A7W0CNW4_9ACTN|nr:hypothetical protein [Nonomuraea soli]MBA2894570.1 hypothetical protein [Nonomuraea soli]